MSNVGIFIEFNNTIAQFPVNPEEIQIIQESNNHVVEVVKLGEINVLNRTTKLQEFTFESFFPWRNRGAYIRTSRNFRNPNWYINLFNRIRRSGRPCRLIISGSSRVNMLVSIEEFTQTRKGADGDVYFKIILKEFRNHQVRTVHIRPLAPRTPPRATTTPARPPSTNRAPRVGDIVIVNGRLHRDSFGAGPGQTEVNARRRISHVVSGNGRVHVIHVKTLEGGWRGWVRERDVRLV